MVKSEHCSLKIPELDFEIPAQKTKGVLNTIEGFLADSIEDLQADQEQRKVKHIIINI
jgi:zinc finger protein